MKKLIIALLLALPMAVSAQKIGHVNVDAIVQGMPEYTTLMGDMEKLQKQFQDELQRKQADVQAKADAYEKEKAGLTEALRTYREQEIQKALTDYQQFGQSSEEQLQKTYNASMETIQQKVMTAVEEVGKAGSFAYIIPAGAIAYIGAGATDITDQVKAKVGAK